MIAPVLPGACTEHSNTAEAHRRRTRNRVDLIDDDLRDCTGKRLTEWARKKATRALESSRKQAECSKLNPFCVHANS